MKVTLVDHMGSDLSVVNAARVSFAKQSSWKKADTFMYDEDGGMLLEQEGVLNERDERLIRFLARHNHWTPFGHTCVTLHVKAPIFLARQLGKHQVGLVWNEVSRRYVDSEPEFFEPEVWRSRPTGSVKQGSGGDNSYSGSIGMAVGNLNDHALKMYQVLIEEYKVAPEQARMVLPQSTYTEWYWTGSIAAFARVYSLRIDKGSQREAQDVAEMIGEVIEPLFPVSWEALVKEILEND